MMDELFELFKSIIEDFIPFYKRIGFKLPEARENLEVRVGNLELRGEGWEVMRVFSSKY